MSRLDIKIKAGTKIIVDYGDGMTITHETITDTDIDHLYDTLGRLEEIERVDRENRSAGREVGSRNV